MGVPNLIGLDIGATSADVGLVVDGHPKLAKMLDAERIPSTIPDGTRSMADRASALNLSTGGTGLRIRPCGDELRPAVPSPPLDAAPIGLTFSGGGFRATLAALGTALFLADAGLLSNVRCVSSVSLGLRCVGAERAALSVAKHVPTYPCGGRELRTWPRRPRRRATAQRGPPRDPGRPGQRYAG
jgi:hypothetical protein